MNRQQPTPISPQKLAEWLQDARARTLRLTDGLSNEQMLGPRLPTVNPLLWEIGHVAWFQEKWVRRQPESCPSIRPNADALYDSAAVVHETRWDLPLPGRDETLRYLNDVRDLVVQRLEQPGLSPRAIYFTL